jgi:hypothetical protein
MIERHWILVWLVFLRIDGSIKIRECRRARMPEGVLAPAQEGFRISCTAFGG